jgi:enoyl-CoA hydratase/carnithine racemase
MADLEYTRDGAVATILLNRPARRNAFTLPMIDDWRDALIEARADDAVNVVVVRGEGDAFCAGVDLGRVDDEMGQGPLEFKELLRERVQRIPFAVEDLDKPMIAAISGPAIGAGLDMALMADLRVANHNALLGESYINVGFVPGAGGAYYLPRIVGIAKAFELFITGEFIDAQEAHRIGLVNRLFENADYLDQTYALAEKIASANPVAARMLKRSLYQSVNTDLRTALDLVSSHMGIIRSTNASRASFTQTRDRVLGA